MERAQSRLCNRLLNLINKTGSTSVNTIDIATDLKGVAE